MEISTYGSEIVAGIIFIEIFMDLSNRLIIIGLPINRPSPVYGDTICVITNLYLNFSIIKNKHTVIDYQNVRE